MDTQYFTSTEEERTARRAQRTAARRQREKARRRAMLLRSLPLALLGVLALSLLTWALVRNDSQPPPEPEAPAARLSDIPPAGEPEPEPEPPFSASANASTVQLEEETGSGFAILLDVEDGTILAEKNARQPVSPASMTKIMTLLVAAERLESLEDTAAISHETLAYCLANDCSMAGFCEGEEVPLRDLLLGTILPSGAEAALTLAEYVAGSHAKFVTLMNEKADSLGLEARFANCVGLYDPGNVSSVYDMAVILEAAMENELCWEILTQRTCELPAREPREDPLELSNWFIRRIEDHMPGGVEILGAKTGFVNESGNCAASFARGLDGRLYICVTAQGTGIWPCIFDHVALYGMLPGAAPREDAS